MGYQELMELSTVATELQRRLAVCQAGIWYEPLPDEPDPDGVPWLKPPAVRRFMLPRNRRTDPFEAAKILRDSIGNETCFILIPGQRFDSHGTRIGRGGGWIDRFLSAVPVTWIRIGICNRRRLSSVRLLPHPWDQPVDWLSVQNGDVWDVVETDARPSDTRRDTSRPWA
jgi:5-formyltetrahydrofolate cyclo-ligase